MLDRRVCVLGYEVIGHGVGKFGMIYSGITGQDAVNFLLELKSGEVIGALYHAEVGFIDLVFGSDGDFGFGLAHILEKHPEIVINLPDYISKSKVLQKLQDRTILLYEPYIKSIISLTWYDFNKKWLVTAYEKIPD